MDTKIEVIGGVRAVVDGEPIRLRRQVQRLTAILVAAGPTGIEGSALAEELWVGKPPTRWNAAVRNALTALRARAGADIVQTDSGRYSLQCTIDDVDAWRLLATAASEGARPDPLDHVRRFQPFDGLELTPLLREMTEALHDARLRMIDQVTMSSDLPPAMIAGLVASVRADPFAERAAAAIITMLIRLGRNSEALGLVDDVERAYAHDLEIEAPATITRLRLQPDGGHLDLPASPTLTLARPLPSVIGDLTQGDMTQRHRDLAKHVAAEITEQRLAKRLAVIGVAGSGKSRFTSEIGRRLHAAGTDVIFAAAVGGETSAYSPFLTASPLFRQRYLELTAPTESAVWALWSSIIEGAGAQGRPVAFIVDDAQLLDRPSIRLLQFMHRMQLAVPITTIIVGRPSTDEPEWRAFESELLDDDRSGTIGLPPLDVDEVAELIRRRWPRRSELIYRDAATEVAEASGGLPMVALLLIESLTGPTLHQAARHRSRHVDVAVDRMRSLEPATQEVLAAANVLEATFSGDDVAALLDRDPDETDAALDAAVRAGVLVDLEVPGTYRFVHDLLRQGSTSLATRTIRARWCLRLIESSDDPLRTAHLALAARSLLEAETVARLVGDGAQTALGRGMSRQAAELAEQALAAVSGLDHGALACLAIAQLRLGALDEAAITRARMLDCTTTPRDHARATETLVESITVVETDNPTTIRVEDFDRLEVDGLDHDLQLRRAVWLARLATWAGDAERRDHELQLARSLQRTADEAGVVFHAEWRCGAHQIDDAWFDRVDELCRHVEDLETAALLRHAASLEFAVQGRWANARTSGAEGRRLAEEAASSEVVWLSMLAQSAFAFAQGDLADSEELADAAFAYGMLFALPLAPAARAAQAFGVALHTGSVADWLEAVEARSPHLLRATLAIAAVGRARFEVGRVDEAWMSVEPIMSSVLDGQPRLAVATVAVLAPLIRRRASPTMRQRCIELVRNAGDGWVITASGVGVHGPTTRTLAILEGDRRGLERLRHRLAGQPTWIATIDRDLATLDQES